MIYQLSKHWKFAGILAIWLGVTSFGWAGEELLPGDSIHVWVKGETDLTVDRTLGQDGTINYPLVGSIKLSGFTLRDAAKLLAKRLDDGYLREPMVQVDRSGSRASLPEVSTSSLRDDAEPIPLHPSHLKPVVAEPLDSVPTASSHAAQRETMNASAPVLKAPVPSTKKKPASRTAKTHVEVIDGKTGNGLGSAVLLFEGKIFQTNHLGQLLIDSLSGPMILMADGYKVVQGPIERFLRPGAVKKIYMDPVEISREVEVRVLDIGTSLPLPDVQIRMNRMRVKTNRNGVLRIKEMKTEYGEIELSKKGFKTIRQVIDFKDNRPRIIAMVAN